MKHLIIRLLLTSCISLIAVSCKPKEEGTPSSGSSSAQPEPPPAEDQTKVTTEPSPSIQENPEPPKDLKVGDPVSLDAIQAATWIQGSAPEKFEPGHVYLFECWATWCGPCIRLIPHMNQLHKKYSDKGLHLYGMHIFEREDAQTAMEKASAFVKKQGEGMQYPVAFASKNSMFSQHWVSPAKVRGIPHAFLVIDGTIRFMGHPAYLKEELIEGLLNGSENAEKQLQRLAGDLAAQKSEQDLTTDYRKAIASRDTAVMEALLQKIEKEHPKSDKLPMLKADILLAQKNWKEVESMISDPEQRASLSYTCSRVGLPSGLVEDIPMDLIKKLSSSYAEIVSTKPSPTPPVWLALSGLQFRAQELDAARTSAAKALELATADPKSSGLPLPIFEQFKEAVDSGRIPDAAEFNSWLKSAMSKRR